MNFSPINFVNVPKNRELTRLRLVRQGKKPELWSLIPNDIELIILDMLKLNPSKRIKANNALNNTKFNINNFIQYINNQKKLPFQSNVYIFISYYYYYYYLFILYMLDS